MSRDSDILFTTEYIKNVLYFATVKPGKVLQNTSEVHYFCIDNELQYQNYYSDFGPLNLGCVYQYCKILNDKLQQYLNKQTIVHYTSSDPKKKANSAFLLGCYGVLYLNLAPREAIRPLVLHGQFYRPFQDATQGNSMYTITILDCLFAIKKAQQMQFFDFQDFSYDEYERLDKIEGGDLNWIVPGKFLAFIGPVDYSISLFHPPEMYIEYFRENNVKIVIRLNKRMYDSDVFSNAGITHYDLFFPDGSCPPKHILMKFLQISEEANGAIAVHCKGWLEHLEPWLTKQGNIYRKRIFQDTERFPRHEFGVYSICEKMMRQKPLMFNKVPSMSQTPRFQRPESPSMSPSIKAEVSRIKEVTNKGSETDQYCWSLMMKPKVNTMNSSKTLNRGSVHTREDILGMNKMKRGNGNGAGAGEPRPIASNSPSRARALLAAADERRPHSPNDPNPIPTFRTSQGPMIKSLADAKSYLKKSSLYNQQREKSLNSAMTVTPLRSAMNNPGFSTPYSFVACAPVMPVQRKRLPLGRSPSPSPSSSPTRPLLKVEASRATNTDLRKSPNRDRNRFFRDALAAVKPSGSSNGGSIGAASVGVASLGARREAPAAKRAPSVRSDERPLATQGDMLNSIKFQRRFRDTLNSEKFSSIMMNEKNRVSALSTILNSKYTLTKDRTSSKMDPRLENARLNSGWKPTPALGYSPSRDKGPSSTSKFFQAPRPSSPKGRTRSPYQ